MARGVEVCERRAHFLACLKDKCGGHRLLRVLETCVAALHSLNRKQDDPTHLGLLQAEHYCTQSLPAHGRQR
jgi:hypothetical protein